MQWDDLHHTVGAVYEFSADVKLDHTTCSVGFFIYNGPVVYVGNNLFPVAFGQWTRISGLYLARPTDWARIGFSCYATADIHIDNIAVRQVSSTIYTSASTEVGASIVANGDFENGASTEFFQTVQGSMTTAVVDGEGKGGSKAYKLTIAVGTRNANVYMYQQVPTQRGQVYRFSLDYMFDAQITSFNCQLSGYMGMHIGSNRSWDPINQDAFTDYAFNSITPNAWKTLSGLVVAPEDNADIFIALSCSAPSAEVHFWYDNIALTPVD